MLRFKRNGRVAAVASILRNLQWRWSMRSPHEPPIPVLTRPRRPINLVRPFRSKVNWRCREHLRIDLSYANCARSEYSGMFEARP
jgi:hypothetical protein